MIAKQRGNEGGNTIYFREDSIILWREDWIYSIKSFNCSKGFYMDVVMGSKGERGVRQTTDADVVMSVSSALMNIGGLLSHA